MQNCKWRDNFKRLFYAGLASISHSTLTINIPSGSKSVPKTRVGYDEIEPSIFWARFKNITYYFLGVVAICIPHTTCNFLVKILLKPIFARLSWCENGWMGKKTWWSCDKNQACEFLVVCNFWKDIRNCARRPLMSRSFTTFTLNPEFFFTFFEVVNWTFVPIELRQRWGMKVANFINISLWLGYMPDSKHYNNFVGPSLFRT